MERTRLAILNHTSVDTCDLILQFAFDVSSTKNIFEYGCYEKCTNELDRILCFNLKKQNNDFLYDKLLTFSCTYGYLDIIKMIILHYIKHISTDVAHLVSHQGLLLQTACQQGNIDVVYYLIKLGETNYEFGILGAGLGNNIEIVKLMITVLIAANHDFDENVGLWLCGACYGGDISIVKMIFDLGDIKDEWQECIQEAYEGKNLNIIKFIGKHHKYCKSDNMLEYSCESGDLDIFKYTINYYKNYGWDYNNKLYYACFGGNMDIINILIELHDDNWEEGLAGACKGGYINIVQFMIKHGAHNWKRGVIEACKGGHINIVKLMVEYGSHNWGNIWKDVYEDVYHFDDAQIYRLLLDKICSCTSKNKMRKNKAKYIETACLIGDIGLVGWIQSLYKK